MVSGPLDELLVAMTAADGLADLSLSFDVQAGTIGIGGAIGAKRTADAVRIVNGVGRKRDPYLP